jgi:GntR family transcriptional repressor for pyruvate dehydrogenase complex
MVSGRVEEMIRTGQLQTGQRLPPERALAGAFGVSRGTLREAMHELWLKGLVDRRRGHGTVVVATDPARSDLTRLMHDRLTPEALTLLQVMDYRLTVEPPIAARAAERARGRDIANLRAIVQAMELEQSVQVVAELDAEFHTALAVASGNTLLIQLQEFSAEWMASSRSEALQSRRRRAASIQDHRAVLAAIESHDPAGAAAAMTSHLRAVSEMVLPKLADRSSAAKTGGRRQGKRTSGQATEVGGTSEVARSMSGQFPLQEESHQ